MRAYTEFSLKSICNAADCISEILPQNRNYLFSKTFGEHMLSFENRKRLPRNYRLDGWRFLISVHPEDIEQAWALLAPILFEKKEGVLKFEFVNLYDGDDRRALKHHYQLIIHTFADGLSSYKQNTQSLLEILGEIEWVLSSARIRVSPKQPRSTRQVLGSNYVAMRNVYSAVKDAKYTEAGALMPLSSRRARVANEVCSYNPYYLDNPYAALDLRAYNPGDLSENRHSVFHNSTSGLTTLSTHSSSPLLSSNHLTLSDDSKDDASCAISM